MNNTNNITIGKTTYYITHSEYIGASPLDPNDRKFSNVDIDAQGYVEGPRGAVKNIICFSNGCTRVVSHRRSQFGPMPSGHKDTWGDEAADIREQLLAVIKFQNRI